MMAVVGDIDWSAYAKDAAELRARLWRAEKVIEAAREWATPDNFYSYAAQRKFLEAIAEYDAQESAS